MPYLIGASERGLDAERTVILMCLIQLTTEPIRVTLQRFIRVLQFVI